MPVKRPEGGGGAQLPQPQAGSSASCEPAGSPVSPSSVASMIASRTSSFGLDQRGRLVGGAPVVSQVLDLGLRVGIVGQPPDHANPPDAAHQRQPPSIRELLASTSRARVPVPARWSPPPTSRPRSINTTPSSGTAPAAVKRCISSR